jgi:hypothetical protein
MDRLDLGWCSTERRHACLNCMVWRCVHPTTITRTFHEIPESGLARISSGFGQGETQRAIPQENPCEGSIVGYPTLCLLSKLG